MKELIPTDNDIGAYPCSYENLLTAKCSGGVLAMIEPSDPEDPVPNQYSGVVNASSLFIKVSK